LNALRTIHGTVVLRCTKYIVISYYSIQHVEIASAHLLRYRLNMLVSI